jgi:hypothetical protein
VFNFFAKFVFGAEVRHNLSLHPFHDYATDKTTLDPVCHDLFDRIFHGLQSGMHHCLSSPVRNIRGSVHYWQDPRDTIYVKLSFNISIVLVHCQSF